MPTCPLMRPMVRAYSHQGHDPRVDQTGRIHISDFRNPSQTISLASRSRSIHSSAFRPFHSTGRRNPHRTASRQSSNTRQLIIQTANTGRSNINDLHRAVRWVAPTITSAVTTRRSPKIGSVWRFGASQKDETRQKQILMYPPESLPGFENGQW